MRNLLLTPAIAATLATYPIRLPGVDTGPSPDTLAALTMLRGALYCAAAERDLARARSIVR